MPCVARGANEPSSRRSTIRPDVAGQQFTGRIQNAAQHGFQIEPRGQRPADFQQIFALTDTIIGEHRGRSAVPNPREIITYSLRFIAVIIGL